LTLILQGPNALFAALEICFAFFFCILYRIALDPFVRRAQGFLCDILKPTMFAKANSARVSVAQRKRFLPYVFRPLYACATVGLAIESANIVGYQANTVPTGYSMITPTFINVDGTDYNIDNFLLNNVEDCDANLQVVNADGSWGTMCFWFNAFGDLPAGWFADADGTIPAGITLQPGQSVFFYTKASGAKVSIPSAIAE
jgi:hypothetical protein